MVIVDANAILRIILSDNAEMVEKVKKLILQNEVLIKNEVMAEILYVLIKTYKIQKEETCRCLLALLEIKNVCFESKEIIRLAIQTYQQNNIDFVDCLLYAYHIIDKIDVFTFDKKMIKLIDPVEA